MNTHIQPSSPISQTPEPNSSPETLPTDPTSHTSSHLPHIHDKPSPSHPHKSPSTQPSPPSPTPTPPTIPPTPQTQLPRWIHHESKLTIQLPDSTLFQKGILLQNPHDDDYIFSIGRSHKMGLKVPIPIKLLLALHQDGKILQGHTHLIRQLRSLKNLSSSPQTKTSPSFPPLPTEHKPISTWPATTSFSIDQLRRGFGFRQIDSILPQIQQTSVPNFTISTKDREKIIDLGEIATVSTTKSQKSLLPLPHHFAEVMHMDILYGTVTAHENIRYALFIVDRAFQL